MAGSNPAANASIVLIMLLLFLMASLLNASGMVAAPAASISTGMAQQDATSPKSGSISRPEKPPAAPSDSTKGAAPDSSPASSTQPSSKSHKKSKSGSPKKVVVHQGSTTDTELQISAGLPEGKASQNPQSTADLLSATDANLRKLSNDQKDSNRETVEQIRHYMEDARSAVDQGDVERGHTLALKARLLSDELLKPR
jgi:hypothetical protein